VRWFLLPLAVALVGCSTVQAPVTREHWVFSQEQSSRDWEWQHVAANNRVIARSPHPYQRLRFAEKNAARHGWDETHSVTEVRAATR
jgi:hypothetical protein